MSSSELVHFDEIEAELESTLREMVREFSKQDPSVRVESGDVDDLAEEFSDPYATKFLDRLKELKMILNVGLVLDIRNHFQSVISEYDTLDTVVQAKVEDQTPELGINALISEHAQPIMQKLQEADEGWTFLGDSATERREKRHV